VGHEIPKGLNAFSRRLLKALLAKHSDWAAYAQVGGIYPAQDPAEAGTLLLRVSRPYGPPEEYLEISTAAWESGPEITVQFGGTHNHWDHRFQPGTKDGGDVNKDTLITGIVGLVEEIVNEQTVALCTFKDGRTTSGAFVPSPGKLHPAWRFAISRVCRVRSWKGTYDDEHVITEADIDPALGPDRSRPE
jgi:hypothetical protein